MNMRRLERFASTVDAVLDVQREIGSWVRALTGEGHATIQQARRRLSAEQEAVQLHRPRYRHRATCAEKGRAMKRATRWIGLVIAACVITGPAVAAGAPRPQALNAHAAAKVRVAENYGRLPLSFEANRGQTAGHVKFLSRGSGYNLFLTSTEAVLALSKPEGKPSAEQPTSTSGTVVRMKLIGGNSASRITGLQELPGKSNYFIGNDSSKWRTNIPSYARVRYDNV